MEHLPDHNMIPPETESITYECQECDIVHLTEADAEFCARVDKLSGEHDLYFTVFHDENTLYLCNACEAGYKTQREAEECCFRNKFGFYCT